MRTHTGHWIDAVRTGLLWGGIVIFLALVGIMETFGGRAIIVGVISLGHTLLLGMGLAAGYHTARREPTAALPAVVRGLVTGAVVGGVAALLVFAGALINLRAMFVSASPQLFDLLTFGRGVSGTGLLVLGYAAAGLAGASLSFLRAGVRRTVGSGLIVVLAAGLFQDLFQLLLQTEGLRAGLRGFLFSAEGLSLRGGVTLFAVGAGITVLWRARGPALRSRVAGLPARQRLALRWAGIVAAVALAMLLPFAAGPFLSQVLVLVGLYILMGLGLNLEVGFAGLLDLGFVAFFAIGAYTVALLTSLGPLGIAHWSFWAALPVAFLVSLLAGVVFGIPILGIRGDYLAIATLGFGEIIRLLVLSTALRPWLGGSHGIVDIPKPVLFGLEFRGPEQLFYITLLASALIAFTAKRLRDSRAGRAWMAIREDEDVAEAMGINTINSKLLAYGIGGAFAGMGGAIFAVMIGSVYPHSFSLLISINVLALIIVGGMGSLPGVIVGSLFLVGLPELLREFVDFRFLVYGAVLVLMMQARPEGLWPAAAQRRELRTHIDRQPEGSELTGAREAAT